MELKRYKIIEPDKNANWMDIAALNPAVIEYRGIIHMLFRVRGELGDPHPETMICPISLGHAWSTDGGKTWEIDKSRPCLIPACEVEPDKLYTANIYGEKVVNYANGTIEDPRLTMIDGKCYMTAACRFIPLPQMWKNPNLEYFVGSWAKNNVNNPFGIAASLNLTVSVLYEVNLDALANNDYDNAFSYITNLTNPEYGENRDVVLFSERMMIDGKLQYVMIERPVEPYLNPQLNEKKPAMVISCAERFEDFARADNEKTVLAAPKYYWEDDRIGASAPPLKVNDRYWILSYHGKQDDENGYSQNFMLLETVENSLPIIKKRNTEPIIRVEEKWEFPKHFKIPCLFITGMIRVGDDVLMSYGAADECVGVMFAKYKDILEYLDIETESIDEK